MQNNILKIIIVSMFSLPVYAVGFQLGKGDFEMKGGFIGLNKPISTDITSYSLIEQHQTFGSASCFYKYNFTLFNSDKLQQSQQTINSYPNGLFSFPTGLTVPDIDYKVQGVDLNLVLGKDFLQKGENDYLGIGIMLGISFPLVESKKKSENNDSLSNNAMNLMQKSKTQIITSKIGPSLTARTSLNKFFSVYGSATYAFQTANIENNYLNSSLTANGTFQEYDIGIKFQPVSYDYDLGEFTLSPRLYATLGYRYSSWNLYDIKVDVTNTNTRFKQVNFNMNSAITYLGIGYSF